MSGPVQQRVQQLIELSYRSATDSAEGRNAAVAACRLIREHGLLVIRPEELVTIVHPTAAAAPLPRHDTIADIPEPRPAGSRKRKRRERAPRPVAEVASTAAGEIVSGWVRDVLGGGRRGG